MQKWPATPFQNTQIHVHQIPIALEKSTVASGLVRAVLMFTGFGNVMMIPFCVRAASSVMPSRHAH